MPKIIKFSLICILAFFILDRGLTLQLANAQDVVTLENGLRIIIEEDHRNPIVVFSAFIDIGSASEGEYLGSGISHLIEHMLFKGTKKYPPGAIEDILHIYGGKIEGFTSYDYTGFRITILKEHAEVGLDILREILTSPTFNEKELKKEMQVIEREMDLAKDNIGKRISRLAFSSAYTRHPYRLPIIGYRENFKRLDRQDLVKFFKANYVPERTIIAVVGDIDKDVMLDDMRDLFETIPRGRNVLFALPREPEQIAVTYVEESADIDGAYLNIAFHSTSLLNKDLYALDLLAFILGQGESSVLNENVRIKEELVLSISAYNYTPRDPGLFIISSALKEENVKEAIDEIMRQLDNIKEKGVTDEELVKAKNNFLADYIYRKETIESKANDLAIAELLTGNFRFFELYIEGIKSVTLDDLRRVSKKYLLRENMTVVVLSKSGNTLNLSSGPAMEKGQRKIKKIMLKNNLPVLVSENSSLPIISISLLFKGGLRVEKEVLNGISKVTSLMLMDGLESMTREGIARLYESKGMSVSTYSANNSVGISVDCLKEYTEDAFKLISDLCMKSIFPEEELRREKNELLSAIDMQDNVIFNHGHRLLKELLFERHPYRFQTIGTHESIERIQRTDVVEFHRNLLSADNMVLGVSGDCDSNEIEALAEKYFARISSKASDFVFPEKEPPIDNKRELLVQTEKEQSLVLFGFHGIDIYNRDRYAVEIIVDMLSSASGILFKEIREKKGLSYAPGAFQVIGVDPGYIVIYALTSKENIGKVKRLISKEIASFVKNGASAEALVRSKNHLKAMRQMAMQTNAHFIFTIALDELYGLGYNRYEDYSKNIDAVTEQDIKRVAGELLTLDKCAVVVLEGER